MTLLNTSKNIFLSYTFHVQIPTGYDFIIIKDIDIDCKAHGVAYTRFSLFGLLHSG